MSWVVGDDFNDILFSFEKMRGVAWEARKMERFRETLENVI